METKRVSAERCGTDQFGVKADRLPLKRADQLNLGDRVLLADEWRGVRVAEVQALAWMGEDVAMTLDGENSFTSPGNTFRVVA